MIKAIIFDYYGVLLTNTHSERLAKLYTTHPEKAEEFSAVNRAADVGILSHEESRHRMAELLGIPYERLLEEYARGEQPNESLIAFITTRLKPQYKIGLLSNSTSREQLDLRFAAGRLDEIFDEVVSSGDIGFIKPQPEAYEFTAMKLGVLPEECVMVDDIADFCRGAEQVGMQAVQYSSIDQVIGALAALLHLDSTPEKL